MKNIKIIKYDNDNINQKKYLKLSKNKKIFKKDRTDYSQVIVRKPWGYEYLIFENEYVAVWILHIKSKHETSMHCHPQKKTSLIILNGSVISKNLNQKFLRKNGQAVFIDKKIFHSTSNIATKNAIIMEIESPNNKHDLLRLKDPYGRVSKGYEKKGSFSVNTNNYNYISLNSQNTYHNSTKKIGNTSISFIKISNNLELINFIKSHQNQESLLSILYGEIFIADKIYTAAETLELNFMHKSLHHIDIKNEVIILLTKQNDDEVKCSDLIFNILENENINKAFVVAGDSNLHLLDSLGKKENFEYLVYNNEFYASFAALGQSKLTHKPSLLILSSGSSAVKAIEAITNAFIDSEPLIVISGQSSAEHNFPNKLRQLGNKSVDIVKLIKSITKYSYTIKKSNELTYHLEKAIYLSKKGRAGPVWIDIPIDLLGKNLQEKNIKHFDSSKFEKNFNYKKLNQSISKIFTLLSKSNKPVLLVGYGVRLSNSQKQLIELVNMLKIPVMTSRRGADLVDNKNRYFFGRPGVYGNRYSNILIQKSDLLITLGSRLSTPLIGRRKLDFAKHSKIIMIDIDEQELNKKTINPFLKISNSCDIVIDLLFKNNLKIKKFDNWIKNCQKIKKQISFDFENYKHSKHINPYLFIKKLSKIIPQKSIIFMDGGPIMNYVMQGFEIKKNQRLINASGLDNDGFSFPAVLGLRDIEPYNTIVVFCEETSILSSLENLNSVYERNVPIKIFAFSGAKNIALRNSQKDFFDSRYVATSVYNKNNSLIEEISLNKIGVKINKINSPLNYEKKISKIFSNLKPEIFSIKLDPSHKLIPKLGFSIDFYGNWSPKPLEDMYPFIPNAKLKKLMKV